MAKNDKIIVAFLVSIGIFSASNAIQYVSELSVKEKNKIAVTAKKSSNRIVICTGVESFNSGAENSSSEA